MWIRFLLLIFLFLSIVFEATIIRIPLTFVALLLIAMTQKKNGAFFLAIVSGFILDSVTFRVLGATSTFFLLIVGLLFLYGRKYETHHLGFASVFLFVGSVAYGYIFGLPDILLGAFFATLIGIIVLLPMQVIVSNQPQELGL